MSTRDGPPTRSPGSTPEVELREAAQRLGEKALETLAALMQDEASPATIRLAAAREVLDRGHGRPKAGGQEPPAEGGEGGFTVILKRYSDVTDEERALGEEGEP